LQDFEIMRESETIVPRKTQSMRGLFDELLYLRLRMPLSFLSALPRWLTAFFFSLVSCAKVFFRGGKKKSGS